jgi:hypothetical protein
MCTLHALRGKSDYLLKYIMTATTVAASRHSIILYNRIIDLIT